MPTWPDVLDRVTGGIFSTGRAVQRSRWRELVSAIDGREPQVRQLSDESLRKEALALRFRAKSGEATAALVVESFALTREAARRRLGMRHYDVQLMAGIAMNGRAVVEMQTGEGKTLAATLPLALYALSARSAHLATANDYLARRDAEWMRPVYEALGLTVGFVESNTPTLQRRLAYDCDVTYGTAKEFGFDFLRDRLQGRQQADAAHDWLGAMLGDDRAASRGPMQRAPHFLLIDEADSILIDEARTPLIISSLPGEDLRRAAELFHWCARVAPQLNVGEHFRTDPRSHAVTLTAAGRRAVRAQPRPELLRGCDMLDVYEHVELAVHVERNLQRDRHYVLRDGEVVIVDEFTGRLAEGRRWRDGIHQAVEAREGLEISPPTAQAARVTIQEYVRRYPHVAGMTGTVANSGRELQHIYGMRSAEIPTHRPPRRKQLPTAVFGNAAAKWAAVVREIAKVHQLQRPVLVGTRSIDTSELLSQKLADEGIEHQVLNARRIAEEANIVAAAGQRGKVTIATNMAGRGTDIKLGPGVEEIGGLHVICTEKHDSARIDRQLIGRCGRQGDPGSYRFFLALDDEILSQGLGPDKAEQYARRGRDSAKRFDDLAPLLDKAQAAVEREHYRQRRLLIYHERQRKEIQGRMGLDPYLDTPGSSG